MRRSYLAWASPVLIGLGILWFGGPELTPRVSDSPLSPFQEPETVSPPRQVTVLMQNSIGEPAKGATLVLIEPSVSYATANSKGLAQLNIVGEGPFRWLASLPSHELLSGGPSKTFPKEGLRFAPQKTQGTNSNLRRAPATISILVMDTQETPLAESLIVMRESKNPLLAPCIGISDSEGKSSLTPLTRGEYSLSIYAPGLPPSSPWEIFSLPKIDLDHPEDLRFSVPVSRFQLEGVPEGSIVKASRTAPNGLLNLATPSHGSTLSFGPLPLGTYTFECEGIKTTLVGLAGQVVSYSFDLEDSSNR